MKKIATLLLAAGLVFGVSTGASAIDFKAKGHWLVGFNYGGNGDFTSGGKHAKAGYKNGEDQFETYQRVRLQLEAVASENLSGTVHFEMGNSRWGKADDGGALGADGKIVKVKHAYLDWMIPQTDAKVRMGIQPLSLPSFTTGSQIFNEDTAGVAVNYQFNDTVGATLFWARPYNDNGTDYKNNKAYMDNVDMFALAVPVTLDGVKVTPFGMLGFIGPNAFRNVNGNKAGQSEVPQFGSKATDSAVWGGYTPAAWRDSQAGLFPLGGNVKGKKITSYGTAWWLGLTADITVLDPLRIAADFNYGSVSWDDDNSLNRAGWLATALVEYKMDWGTPGIVGWYGSGDDDNPKNGSERMPVMGNNGTNNGFSNFAFNGQPYMGERESVIGKSMAGTWGVGLRVKDVSFVEDLKHTLRVNYIGGTNAPKNLKKLEGGEYYAGSDWALGNNRVGLDGLYMTTEDSALEIGLTNTYKIYDNLTLYVEGTYLATSLNGHKRIGRGTDGKRAGLRDPWNVNVTFAYTF